MKEEGKEVIKQTGAILVQDKFPWSALVFLQVQAFCFFTDSRAGKDFGQF